MLSVECPDDWGVGVGDDGCRGSLSMSSKRRCNSCSFFSPVVIFSIPTAGELMVSTILKRSSLRALSLVALVVRWSNSTTPSVRHLLNRSLSFTFISPMASSNLSLFSCWARLAETIVWWSDLWLWEIHRPHTSTAQVWHQYELSSFLCTLHRCGWKVFTQLCIIS